MKALQSCLFIPIQNDYKLKKILLNDGLIETLSSGHPSVCKCLGQWERKSGLEKKSVAGCYCKNKAQILERTMETLTMNNGSAGRKWSESSMVNELGQYRLSTLDSRQANQSRQLFVNCCVTSPLTFFCRWALLSVLLRREKRSFINGLYINRVVQYSFLFDLERRSC